MIAYVLVSGFVMLFKYLRSKKLLSLTNLFAYEA